MPTVRSSQPRLPRTLTPEQRLERMVRAAEASASADIQEVAGGLDATTSVARAAAIAANNAQATTSVARAAAIAANNAQATTSVARVRCRQQTLLR